MTVDPFADRSRYPRRRYKIMILPNKNAFVKGALLAITFLVILVGMFMPFFDGSNALRAADRLFNSIAKGSTYYIGDLQKKAESLQDSAFTANLKFDTQQTAEKAAKILRTSGAQANLDGTKIAASGDLKQVLGAALTDSEAMFENKEAPLLQKYGMPGKEAMFVWWSVLKEIDKDLSRQKRFKLAAFTSTVVKKGVEVGYNFYGIGAQTASSKGLPLTLSLIFYVIYTLWWGIAIMFLFDAFGLEMKARAKKEV